MVEQDWQETLHGVSFKAILQRKSAIIPFWRKIKLRTINRFILEKKPIRYGNTKVWRNALKCAGIADFRWHDLRHIWANWLIQSGTPLCDLQEMGRWKSAAMVRR
jgi:integrase